MEYISKSFGNIAGLVGSIFNVNDKDLIDFCRSEYRNDWFWRIALTKGKEDSRMLLTEKHTND